jgi:CHAT domain
MNEVEWRRLGEEALHELAYMGFDAATEDEVRRQLEQALAQSGASGVTAVRQVLTSRPELLEWLYDRADDISQSEGAASEDVSDRDAWAGDVVRGGGFTGAVIGEAFDRGSGSAVTDSGTEDTEADGMSDAAERVLGTQRDSSDGDGDLDEYLLGDDLDEDDLHVDEAIESSVKDDATAAAEKASYPPTARGPFKLSLGGASSDEDADEEVELSADDLAAVLEAFWQSRDREEAKPLPETGLASSTRTAHARLEAPAAVQVEVPFPVLVGIAAEPSAGVLAPAPFEVPAGGFALTVSLLLDGFRTADGSRPVRTVLSSPDVPYPTVAIDLVAIDDPTYRAARSLLAEFGIDGHPLGTATRSIQVLHEEPAPQPATAQALFAGDRAPRRPTVWAIPTEGAPDLQITVARGNDEAGRRLLWSAHSPHDGVDLPPEPVVRTLDPEAAGDWARRVMRGVEQRKNAADLGYYLRGVQLLVGDQVPKEIWTALESVAEVLRRPDSPDSPADGHPAVLFATAEPFVPWELARVPRPWDANRPAVLGAQVEFGRWLHDDDNELPAPAVQVRVRDVAVVKGEYTGSARLPEAEEEADHLTSEYGATQVPADLAAVLACLEGRPAADLLHFAVHGKLDVTGLQDGIVMNDKSTLGFESILGVETGHSKLTFLNACQVGEAQEVLGDTAGIVPSFIRIGAQGVIAPLWKVDDAAARGFAERFYAELRAGGRVADFLARERAAAVDDVGSPRSTVLAYLFFGHPRLTVTGLEEKTHAAAPA